MHKEELKRRGEALWSQHHFRLMHLKAMRSHGLITQLEHDEGFIASWRTFDEESKKLTALYDRSARIWGPEVFCFLLCPLAIINLILASGTIHP